MTPLVCNDMDLYIRLSALHQMGIDNSQALSAHDEFGDLDIARPCSRLHEEGPSYVTLEVAHQATLGSLHIQSGESANSALFQVHRERPFSS